jgi:plastocyanin
MTVDPAKLRSVLGIADVTYVPNRGALAIVDGTLSGEAPAFESAAHDSMTERRSARRAHALAANEIGIDNFQFTPPVLTVKRGTTVTWINNDDVPHLILNVERKFGQSKVLDTDERFSTQLRSAGMYHYYCSLHPKMQGQIRVV